MPALEEQTKIPYTSINVAQINEALVTYAANQDIVTGLTALKTAIIDAISDPQPCIQCGGAQATGKIDNDTVICPLCQGHTKTDGVYKADYGELQGYSLVE